MLGLEVATRVMDGIDRLPHRLRDRAEYCIGQILDEKRQELHAAGNLNADLGAILDTLTILDHRLAR